MPIDKNVYVVRGSEDGILGVYTNKKLAYENAVSYLTQNDKASDLTITKIKKDKDGQYTSKKIPATYQNVINVFKTNIHCSIDSSDDASVSIDEFILNK